MLERIKRTVLLDAEAYELVESNAKYTPEAALIVVLTSILLGLGGWIQTGEFAGFVSLAIAGLAGWVVWAGVALFIGRGFFGGQSDLGRVLRVLGYAHTPRVVSIIPFVGGFVGAALSLLCSVVGLRQAMDFGTGKAILTAIPGWLAWVLAYVIIGWIIL